MLDVSSSAVPGSSMGASAGASSGNSSSASTVAAGRVLFHTAVNGFQWVAGGAGSIPIALDSRFDAVSPGADEKMGVSANGTWAVVDTTRFGCDAQACLARMRMDGLGGTKIEAGGVDQHVYATHPAISDNGGTVVFTQQNQASSGVDLVVTRLAAGVWSAPVVITSGSPRLFHRFPVLSPDGATAWCDCGPDADEARGNSICRVPTNGSGVEVVLTPADIPGGVNLHHAWPAGDGSLVFEGEGSGGEQLWRRVAAGGPPVVIAAEYSNDNSPCVFPDGRVASLWLGRPGNATGGHELKITDATGGALTMVVTGVDITDLGLFCAR